jgi:chromosome segregation and condensation protein ScpB
VLIKIRGNKGYDHVKKLCDMKLLNKKKMGHTSELSLSEDFFDYFHLGGADDLIEAGKENKEGG